MLDKNILIHDIYELKAVKNQLEDVVNTLKSTLGDIENKISDKETELLKIMKELNIEVDTEVENITAAVFKKENIGYTSDIDVLNYLKSIGRDDLIKVKVTESLDKINLKKSIKSDTLLAESLDNMTKHSITEYVVVTSNENYSKMLGHINEGSSK